MSSLIWKIARVNLEEGEISELEISENVLRKYLGGPGIATKFLLEEVERGVSPLGPGNKLIFMTGLLTGAQSPSTGRYSVVFKSPLTGGWGQSNSGGFWGAELKRTGYDGIIFEGISPQPVYLLVTDEGMELRDASDLWNKNVTETTKMLQERHGKKFKVACIGIAGENLVRYASIMNDFHRTAGRCGGGAVMGSKRLKAIAVSGNKPLKFHNRRVFEEVAKKQTELLNQSILKVGLTTYGTNMVIDLVNVRGGFPVRNWQTTEWKNMRKTLGSMALREKVFVRAKTCFACPIACGRETEIKSGKYQGHRGEGPEYETVGELGGMCGIDDIEAVTMGGYLCNDYGLDTISTGSTIAFAMECYEKEILTEKDTQGLHLEFGNPDVMIELIHEIARREGIGDLLAEGTKSMSEKLGKGSEHFAMQVKGLELPAYDSRAVQLSGLAYATANRGGDHITAYVQGPSFIDQPFLVIEDSRIRDPFVANPEEVHVLVDLENALTMFDALGACKFMGMCVSAKEWIELVCQYTGWDFSFEEFKKIGERIYNLARIYNVREGFTAADDTLPPRLLEDPLPTGPAQGQVNLLSELKGTYYDLRGWDKETGKPSREKLKELGLEEYIPMIYE
jgi:aldehyde:ferredoxin oxidoreductase